MSKVSIVIPNYNHWQYLKKCLAALSLDENVEVIVVDDGSTAAAPAWIKDHPLKIIKNANNLGLVKSRNLGAAEARGDYILFLDADMAVSDNYIDSLSTFLDENPKAGIVTGRIITNEGERMWFNFGRETSKLGDYLADLSNRLVLRYWRRPNLRKLIQSLARPINLNFASDDQRMVDWVPGAAFMIRRQLFKDLGGFDEEFFLFFEDRDLCLRARKLGWQVFYSPATLVKHLDAGSHKEARRGYMKKSKEYFWEKHSIGWLWPPRIGS